MKDFILSYNDLVRGTANYWKMTSAKVTFHKMDHFLIHKINKLLKRLYPKKSHKWIKAKHFKPDKDKIHYDNYILT